MSENTDKNVLKARMISNCTFYPNTSPTPKDIEYKEKSSTLQKNDKTSYY